MISVPLPPEEKVEQLRHTLSSAIADFRGWYEKLPPQNAWQQPVPVLTHLLQRWLIPRGADLEQPLHKVLERQGHWHAQVLRRAAGEAADTGYYVRLRQQDEVWNVEWIGYRWYEPVDRGIRWLEERELELGEVEVRLVSSSLYKFTSFWLVPSHRHLVVSSTDDELPQFELIDQNLLLRRLIERFGLKHGAGGIRRRSPSSKPGGAAGVVAGS